MIIGIIIGFAIGMTITTIMYSALLSLMFKRSCLEAKKVEELLTRKALACENIALTLRKSAWFLERNELERNVIDSRGWM